MSKLIVVGNRVLIKPQDGEQQTDAGLVLPASVTAQEKIGSGQVVQVGPGYVMPNPDFSEDETWKRQSEVRYLPLQAQRGDFAFFLRKEAIELTFEQADYLIVPHGALLALVRPDAEDVLGTEADELFDDIDG